MSEIETFSSPPGVFIIIIITLDHLLKNNANTKHFDGEMVLAGSVCLNGMKVDKIVQTFHYVPVDFKHYASNSFAFVNDQAEQFRRGWRQLQAGKNDVYLLPESSSSIRKWRHSSFLHSVSSPSLLISSRRAFHLQGRSCCEVWSRLLSLAEPRRKRVTCNPKRKRPNCHCKTPRSCGVGTPRVCRPADYLPITDCADLTREDSRDTCVTKLR